MHQPLDGINLCMTVEDFAPWYQRCQGFGWSADGIVTDHITKMNDEDYDDFLMEDLAQELEVK